MNEMIERVARALHKESGYGEWENFIVPAIYAILTMREPTDEMVDCGQDARLDGGGYYDIWRAMIDAALKEN